MADIRVLLVDDQTLFREGLRLLLQELGGFIVVGEAANGKEAVVQAQRLQPDVVVMDITMGETNGLEATRGLRSVGFKAPILFLTIHDSHEYFFGALDAGASGYVLKDAVGSDLATALRVVHQGGVYLSPSVARRLLEDYLFRVASGEEQKSYALLSRREKEILEFIGQGFTNREIAEKLLISINTVQTHRLRLMEKLDLHSRAELMKYAVRLGMVRGNTSGP
ncbi:MAG: response regulator transcription factor [Chloroflexi bacterium]|nr:response regulator transcription factor [Chloroflexota bacterium]